MNASHGCFAVSTRKYNADGIAPALTLCGPPQDKVERAVRIILSVHLAAEPMRLWSTQVAAPQHFLYFLPLPHVQGPLRPGRGGDGARRWDHPRADPGASGFS